MAETPCLIEENRDAVGSGPLVLPGENVYDAIKRAAARYPTKIAVIDIIGLSPDIQAVEIDYTTLCRRITATATLFRSLGIGAGDPMLFVGPVTLPGLICFWAAHLTGIVMPVNPFLDPAALGEIAAATKARAVLSAGRADLSGSFALAHEIRRRSPRISLHCVFGGGGEEGVVDVDHDARRFDGETFPDPEPALDDTAAYFLTGGTTGAPKAAKLSHRNILTGSVASALSTGIGPDEVVPMGLPLFHVGGGVIGSTRGLFLGHTLVNLTAQGFRSPDVVRHFWPLARRYGFTQAIAVPTVHSDLLKAYDGGPVPIRHFIAGASKLPVALFQAYEKQFGQGILEGYGMTECSGFCAFNTPAALARPGSGGTAAPTYALKIVKLSGGRVVRECAQGEIGHIAVSGPAIFQGYLDRHHDTGKFITGLKGRWIDAGDLGHLDDDGYLWIAGREKDLIIRGGHNIDPAPIEDVLLRHPAVVDAAAVGMPDARVGELPVAFVQIAESAAFDEIALRAFCARHLAERAGTPVRIFPLAALPRTAMRKIYKPELRRAAAEVAVRAILDGHFPDRQPFAATVLCDAIGRLTVELRQTDRTADPAAITEAISFLDLPIITG